MEPQSSLLRQRMKTPRAAAIAGIVFSVLLITSQLLVRTSIPEDPLGPAVDVVRNSARISLALNLMPFAGIAFLWFLAVVRDRLGELEDRFFATVFLGSGLLYIAMTFVAAAAAGGVIKVLGSNATEMVRSGGYAVGRLEIYQLQMYAAKMSAIFMSSTCTISLRTRIIPRWMAIIGFALATILLLSVGTYAWITLVFPLWVLLISVYILLDNLRGRSQEIIGPN